MTEQWYARSEQQCSEHKDEDNFLTRSRMPLCAPNAYVRYHQLLLLLLCLFRVLMLERTPIVFHTNYAYCALCNDFHIVSFYSTIRGTLTLNRYTLAEHILLIWYTLRLRWQWPAI